MLYITICRMFIRVPINLPGLVSWSRLQFNSVIRSSSTSAQNSPLYLLRQRTGLAYNLCREALSKHNNDVDTAEKWLKAQALVHGYQKATKVGGRSAREGLICLAIPKGNRNVTMVKINCETDFVARNKIFKDFAIELTKEIATRDQSSSRPKGKISMVEGIEEDNAHLENFEDRILPVISKLGENIRLAQILHIKVDDLHKNIHLFSKIHAECATETADQIDIVAGKYAAVLALGCLKAIDPESLKQIGSRLCQHVIGYNPEYIELPESIKKKLLDEEQTKKKELEEERKKNLQESDECVEGISRDNWPSLMDHTLIMSEDTSVREYCQQNQVSLIYFKRFELNQ